MNTHFNQLAPAEAERLSLLMEECAEVIQIIGKIQRHGYNSCHPDGNGTSNRGLLAHETGHVLAAMDLLLASEDMRGDVIEKSRGKKTRGYRAKKYLHHQ